MKDWRCQQLLVEFFHRLDTKEFGLLVDLFDEEGSWRRPTVLLRGRAEIASAMAKRSATAVTRHLVSNFLVIDDRGEEVDAVASLTTYSIDSGEHREMPCVQTLADGHTQLKLAQALIGLRRFRGLLPGRRH